MSPTSSTPIDRNSLEFSGRIAIVSHAHPSVSKGGAEIAAYTLFKGLRELGVDALFIAACNNHDRDRLIFGTRYERAVFYEPDRYEWFYHLAPRQVFTDLLRVLEDEAVRLVNFHHFIHFGINRIRDLRSETNLKLFLTLHEFLPICQHHGQMVTRPARHLCYRASPSACTTCYPEHSADQFVIRRELFLSTLSSLHGLIAPSHFLARRFAEWGIERPIEVLENGLAHDWSGVTPRQARGEADAGRPLIFGFFGQITPFKGMDLLLRAIELIARDRLLAGRIRLRIHGGMVGQDSGFVQRFETVTKANLLVSVLGAYANEDVHRLMVACDYVVVPSTWWENSPVVIQEAYAAGCPVIAADIGGMAEKVVDGVTGLHFRAGDPGDLVQALRRAVAAGSLSQMVAGLPMPVGARGVAELTLQAMSDLMREPASDP